MLYGQRSLANRNGLFLERQENVASDVWFPQSIGNTRNAAIVYQEVIQTTETSGEIYISLRVAGESGWRDSRRVIGPIVYQRSLPPIVYSAVMTTDGTIYIVTLSSADSIRLYVSSNGGRSVRLSRSFEAMESVAPRLFLSRDGGLVLFTNGNIGPTQAILYARSVDGVLWSDFAPLGADPSIGFSFLPHYAFQGEREYVIFQSLNASLSAGYQLYSIFTDNGGSSWSAAHLLTDFTAAGEAGQATDFDNQRPYLVVNGGTLSLFWERQRRGERTTILHTTLDAEGRRAGTASLVTPSAEVARSPRPFRLDGRQWLLWFDDTRRGSRIQISTRNDLGSWSSGTISNPSQDSVFGVMLSYRSQPHFYWIERSDTASDLVYRGPDRSVGAPELRPGNYIAGRASNRDWVEIDWQPVEDPSGITAYSYVWSQFNDASVPRRTLPGPIQRPLRVRASQDGRWFLRMAALDGAGNWSEPVAISYERDTRPPEPVDFFGGEIDERGYALSNSPTLSWSVAESGDVAGYTLSFVRLGEAESEPLPLPPQPPRRIVSTDSTLSRVNIDDGLWALSVAAIDSVGNIGETRTLYLRLNKYIPTTEIHSIALSQDEFGRNSVDIIGRGFSIDGSIDRFIIDRDGDEPYDYQFESSAREFRVVDNRTIAGPLIDIISSGSYRIGLGHPERGVYFSPTQLAFTDSGTIVYGDYTVRYSPSYQARAPARFRLQPAGLLRVIVFLFLGVATLLSAARIVSLAREAHQLRIQVTALVAGTSIPLKTKRIRIEKMRRQGISLRWKFTLFVTILVVLVIFTLTLILSGSALNRQEAILVRGLEQRIRVLLDSISTQAATIFVNSVDFSLDLQPLTAQSEIMEEALYVTITGQGRGLLDYNYVWATNDEQIIGSIDSGSEAVVRSVNTDLFIPGETRLMDPISESVEASQQILDRRAKEDLGEAPQQINQINQQLVQLITGENRSEDDADVLRLDSSAATLRSTIGARLREVGSSIEAWPEFDSDSLSRETTEYVFYKPILAWRAGDDPELAQYYRGTVRMGVSTTLILEELRSLRQTLLFGAIVVALIALVAGAAGALLLAAVVVGPINSLVKGVELIRDTEDKSRLGNHHIRVHTRDELSLLADTVNSMTQGLVKAAAASKDLTIGKEVQKIFIPLSTDDEGKKLTTAVEDLPAVEFAGYYEGAKGVSGDYFSYFRLDEEHYAIIKCDVSGKGVSAALIMVEVATIFIDYLKSWSQGGGTIALSPLVQRINDLLESMSFQGRFAAFTLGLLNVNSGRLRLCNAGDTRVHIYRAALGRVEQIEMSPSPAAGVFSSDLVPSGFPEMSTVLEKEDMLLLFTDGLEESKRLLRDAAYNPYHVTAQDIERGLFPEGTKENSGEEEFGLKRIVAVIEAMLHRDRYRLGKLANPDGDEKLEFDFRRLEPTAENIVLGLVGVEKIFRLFLRPDAGINNRVQVDQVIDTFLRRYFEQVDRYFGHAIEREFETNYRSYSHVDEEEQYDDLTILAIRKK